MVNFLPARDFEESRLCIHVKYMHVKSDAPEMVIITVTINALQPLVKTLIVLSVIRGGGFMIREQVVVKA